MKPTKEKLLKFFHAEFDLRVNLSLTHQLEFTAGGIEWLVLFAHNTWVIVGERKSHRFLDYPTTIEGVVNFLFDRWIDANHLNYDLISITRLMDDKLRSSK